MQSPHPIIAAALAPFAPPAEAPELAAYRQRLRRFDWQFEFADDLSVLRAARAELVELRRLQALLDPEGRIWLAVAPQGHGIPCPIVAGAAA